MRFNPIRAFTDPKSRPRAVLWSGALLIAFVWLWVLGIDGTSTYWFCTEPCHIVHTDNTLAYNESTHTKVACVACHEPVGVNPIELTLLKIEVAPDAIKTIARTFELPMNHDNHIALEMPAEQCLQCHDMDNRLATPSGTILIDHEVHAENAVDCTICHNRVAHPDDKVEFVLEGDKKHDDWMAMDACFRCHSLEAKAQAPGECAKCHIEGFDPVPSSHAKSGWYKAFGDSTGHAKAAKTESETIAASVAYFKENPPSEPSHGEIEGEEPTGELKPASQINTCYTCHKRAFCTDCHGGLEIPHPAEFKTDHAKQGYANPAACAKCHARSATEAKGTGFCNACHHPASKPGVAWVRNHRSAVYTDGPDACYTCHDELDCSGCHVRGIERGRESMRKRFESK